MGDQGMSFIPLPPPFCCHFPPFPPSFLCLSLALCADSSSHRVTAGRDLLGLLSFRLGTDSMDGLVFLIYLLLHLLNPLLWCFFCLFFLFCFSHLQLIAIPLLLAKLIFKREKNNALNALVGLVIEAHLSRVLKFFFINVLACIPKMQSRKALALCLIFMLSLHLLMPSCLGMLLIWRLPSLLPASSPASSPVPLMHGARSNVNLSYPFSESCISS